MQIERTQLTLLPGSEPLEARNVAGPGLVVPEPEVLVRLVPGRLSGLGVAEGVRLSALVR
jgi:hypothetical protein